MVLCGVARVLASGLLLRASECHATDSLSLLQTVLRPPLASAASPEGLEEVRLNDGDIQIGIWRHTRNLTSEEIRARLEGGSRAQRALRALAWEFDASRAEQPERQPELSLTMRLDCGGTSRTRRPDRAEQGQAREPAVPVGRPGVHRHGSRRQGRCAFQPQVQPRVDAAAVGDGPADLAGEREFEWLGKQPRECHIWDRTPVKLDWNMANLCNFTLGGVPKGELQLPAAGPLPERNQNWARTWADAITKTATPTPCRIVELDGYWQSAEYFVDHLDMIRSLFWHEESAAKAKSIMDGWLQHDPAVGSLVGVHLRLGDYVGAGRNLNMSYYREAFKVVKMYRQAAQVTCMLFSDDIKLAEKVGEELQECTRILPVLKCPEPWVDKYRCKGREISDWVQFYMMSLLDSLIIADSSYSFWSAALSPKRPLVVAPRITWPLGVASRGDYQYLNNPMLGWVSIDASLGPPDSRAVREHLRLLELGDGGAPPSEWAA